jgi:hypothetical protein
MPKRKSTLSQIAREVKRPAPPRTIAQAQSFDHGLPVSARTNRRASPPPMAQAMPTALSFFPSWATATEGVGSYHVESFDAAPAIVPQVVAATYAAPVVAAVAQPPVAAALELSEIDEELAAIRESNGAPVAAPQPPLVLATSTPPQPEAQPADAAGTTTHPHDVFDRMGKSMRYANTFDLGAFELSRRFDQFDREMARDERADTTDHLEDDLRVIRALSKMQSASAPVAVAPVTTPPPEPIVRHAIAIIPERDGLSADAAAACVLIAWKHRIAAEPEAILRGDGAWAPYRDALNRNGADVLNAFAFDVMGPALPNTDELRSALERFGPLWIGAPDVGIRGRVISGLSVDPATQQALLHIADARDERTGTPSSAPRGVEYTTPYMQFMRTLPPNAAGWVVAHVPAAAKQ